MAWTDERVEKLRQMWSEGMSASQIAKSLGGVTRNAVIGKVHRLGLSNRTSSKPDGGPDMAQDIPVTAKPSVAEPAPKPAAETAPKPKPKPEATPTPAPAPAQVARPAAPLNVREPRPPMEAPVTADLAAIDARAMKISLLELTERTCKWPIGDPTSDDFHFCGQPAHPGKPYCEAHVAVAFQPMSSRRERERERARAQQART